MLIKPALGDYGCNVNCLKSGLTLNVKTGLGRILQKMFMVIVKYIVYSILSYPVDMGAGRMYITCLSRNSYLIFVMHLPHHIDFKIAASVYLVEVAREYFTTAQFRVVGDIKSHFSLFNELLFSGVLSKDSWISRFCKAGASDHNIVGRCLLRFKWA